VFGNLTSLRCLTTSCKTHFFAYWELRVAIRISPHKTGLFLFNYYLLPLRIMPDTPTNEFDQRTRATLAYIWSGAIILMVGYTLWEYGKILAVLTLIIGFVTGTAATILAVYFGAPIASKKADTSTPVVGDGNTVNNVAPIQPVVAPNAVAAS